VSRGLVALLTVLLTTAGLALTTQVAGADPIINVTPDTGVVDGQQVTVLARGFEPGSSVAVGMCRTEVLTTFDVFGDCDTSNYQLRTANSQGRIRAEFKAYRFLPLSGAPVDCAHEGACIIGAGDFSSLADITTSATTPIIFDPGIVNDPPLRITTSVGPIGARTVRVDLTCDRPVDVRVGANLIQPRPRVAEFTWPRLAGRTRIACDGTGTAVVPVEPRQRAGRGGVIHPYRRLLPGPAELRVTTRANEGRFTSFDEVTRTIDIVEPALTRRIRIDHDGVSTRLRGTRISPAGRAVARVEVSCAGAVPSVYVTAQVVAPAPGATYRSATGGAEAADCGPTAQTVTVPLNDLDVIGGFRSDIVPAGPIEAYVTAAVDFGEGAVDMRPLTTRRDMRPWPIRIDPNPRSRLTIGRATTERVRASFDCKRTAPFTVWALMGQQVGRVVFHQGGRTVMSCIEGQTVVFDVPWSGGVRPGVRSAIQLFAVNGDHFTWTGSFQQTQAGWRTVR